MRRRWGRLVLSVVLTLSAYAGRELGMERDGAGVGVTAQTDGSSGGGSGGDGETGGGGGDTGGGGGTDDGSSGTGGSGGGGTGGPGTGGGTTGTTGTTHPPGQVADAAGEKCPGDSPSGATCYTFTQDGDIKAVRVPDGKGGTLVVDLPEGSADGTSNAGASGTSDIDSSSDSGDTYRITVDNRTTNIIEVDPAYDDTRQRILLTIAVLLLVIAAAVLGAMYGRRKRGPTDGPTDPPTADPFA